MRFSGKRILKNAGGQVDKDIEDFRATLLEHRKAFLDEANITTEITALQILDDVGIISADVGRISSQLDGMTTQLKWVSSQVSDAELDRKIGEIPYGTGSRFTPGKGCLTGTRTAFLDFIENWVNDPLRSAVSFFSGTQARESHRLRTNRTSLRQNPSAYVIVYLSTEGAIQTGSSPLHDSCSRSLRPLSFV
ncbi:hypothetical protein EDB84DRAFT_1610513 [Lactarius hengduanensis]|nr:hypothetical protein EDB84DRAFT_1610513 [Lactarius hengduanensis]